MALLDLGDGSRGGCRGAGHEDDPVPHEGQLLGGNPPKAPTAPGNQHGLRHDHTIDADG